QEVWSPGLRTGGRCNGRAGVSRRRVLSGGCEVPVLPKGGATVANAGKEDEIIEVGSRIPQALIDDLKRDPRGNLRLKFRMSEQGTLFGWDIERRPGYDAKAAQRAVMELKPYPHVRPVYSFIGGDFRKIETDY
ncbi:MAG: hypothetical protein PWP11_1055, partial [Thauera sp.]|nr:hypothetical protein [Thauera sp.]